MGDLGVKATESILDDLREKVKANHVKEPAECKQLLIDSIKQQMQVGETAYRFEEETSVVLVIGVNGVGKTTTVGKLAGKLKEQGKKVVIAGADTFRAAAGDQLKEWADRSGVDMIGGTEGADPGSVVYDATAAAKARNADVLLVDTAGRLHNKKNLMNELGKLTRFSKRVSTGVSGDAGCAGCDNRTECAGSGKGIFRCGKDFRNCADKDGWNSQGRNCGGNSGGTWSAGQIYRRGRDH